MRVSRNRSRRERLRPLVTSKTPMTHLRVREFSSLWTSSYGFRNRPDGQDQITIDVLQLWELSRREECGRIHVYIPKNKVSRIKNVYPSHRCSYICRIRRGWPDEIGLSRGGTCERHVLRLFDHLCTIRESIRIIQARLK